MASAEGPPLHCWVWGPDTQQGSTWHEASPANGSLTNGRWGCRSE